MIALDTSVLVRHLFEDEESVSRVLLWARSSADFADALIGDTGGLYGCIETVTFDSRAADRLGWQLLTAG